MMLSPPYWKATYAAVRGDITQLAATFDALLVASSASSESTGTGEAGVAAIPRAVRALKVCGVRAIF